MIPKTDIENVRPRHFNVLNTLIRFHAFADETDEKMCVFEAVVPAGVGVPPHSHKGETEMFFVLEGNVRFLIGVTDPDETVAKGGDFVAVPDGAVHSFVAETDAKMLVINAPGKAHANFFTAIGEVVPEGTKTPLPPTSPDFAQVAQGAAKAGITLFG